MPKSVARECFLVQVRAHVWQMGCLDDISPAGCGPVVKGHQPQERFVSWWSWGRGRWTGPGQAQGSAWPAQPCSRLPGLSSQLPRGPNAPCGMAGVQWEGRGVGKGLCEMGLPQFATLRQAVWVDVPVCESSPHQV